MSPQHLGSVLTDLIGDLGIQRRIDEARTVEAWAALAGPQINSRTNKAWVKGDRLYVRLSSSAWRHALHAQRGQWCRRLNDQLGADLVREIVFR